jgi:hypothetical protein
MTLGTHPVTIVDSSGGPLGGTSGGGTGPNGVTVHTFESANGRYTIALEDSVLTINGDEYKLENPTDTIRIVDDRVEINGAVASPDREEGAGTLLPSHPLLEALDVQLARVDLAEPRVVSLVWESAPSLLAPPTQRRELLTGLKFDAGFQLAVQEDSGTGSLRIAIGDSRSASLATLGENPFVNAAGGSSFFPVPAGDAEGRYMLMRATEGDGTTTHKIVIVTAAPTG